MPSKQLVIIGAGSFGREVLCWARDIPENKREWDVKGFIDNIHSDGQGHDMDVPILSTISDYVPQSDDLFVCAISEPQIKLKYC